MRLLLSQKTSCLNLIVENLSAEGHSGANDPEGVKTHDIEKSKIYIQKRVFLKKHGILARWVNFEGCCVSGEQLSCMPSG